MKPTLVERLEEIAKWIEDEAEYETDEEQIERADARAAAVREAIGVIKAGGQC